MKFCFLEFSYFIIELTFWGYFEFIKSMMSGCDMITDLLIQSMLGVVALSPYTFT